MTNQGFLKWRALLKRGRRNDEGVVDSFVLKTDDFREPDAGEELHVKDFFDGGLEFQECGGLAAAEVDDGDAALEMVTAFS